MGISEKNINKRNIIDDPIFKKHLELVKVIQQEIDKTNNLSIEEKVIGTGNIYAMVATINDSIREKMDNILELIAPLHSNYHSKNEKSNSKKSNNKKSNNKKLADEKNINKKSVNREDGSEPEPIKEPEVLAEEFSEIKLDL